jgi:SAM-dependent methyltransferase
MKCPACDAGALAETFVAKGHRVGRCLACGHGAVLDPPADPTAIYGEGYFEGGADDGYASYGASEAVLRAEFARVLEHLARFAGGGRLVEIGCAYGVFLELARARFDVLGVEVSEAAASRARARGLDVLAELPPTEELCARGPFDAAVLLDVIEHLEDPAAVLASLRPALRGGAALLLTTGDFGSILARAAGRRWRLMTPPQHLHFFTRASLEALLARTGYAVVEARRPAKVVPLRLAAFQLGRALPFARRASEKIPAGIGVPVNLFDTLRVVARAEGGGQR